MDHPPEFFEQLLNSPEELTQEQIEEHVEEVENTINQMEKGFEMLKKMGRQPDNKVLENHKRFTKIAKNLLSLRK